MKVLAQEWIWPGQNSNAVSLSKDVAQLEATAAAIVTEHPGVGRMNESQEITIPDESAFAEMVQEETVFLHPDEMNIIYDSPEYQEEGEG